MQASFNLLDDEPIVDIVDARQGMRFVETSRTSVEEGSLTRGLIYRTRWLADTLGVGPGVRGAS